MSMIKQLRPFLLLSIFLFGLLIFPKSVAEELRSRVVALCSPVLKKKEANSTLPQLELENKRLKEQFERVLQWVASQRDFHQELEQLEVLLKEDDPFITRRARHLQEILKQQLYSLPAKVIFREKGAWTSTVWINVGEQDNQEIGREVVAENSPVVVGKCVVGVVEKVAKRRSRVRLLTDPSLTPCVRVVRGSEQNRLLFHRLCEVVDLLSGREDLYGAKEISTALSVFADQLKIDLRDRYLAKGVLCGATSPQWRMSGQILRGIGFNYDFADEEGEARILRTGETLSGNDSAPLIQTGDILVTTGLDGIFPPDLHVAVVTKILPLHEGGTSYSLEAKPLISDLNTLSEVIILPPTG